MVVSGADGFAGGDMLEGLHFQNGYITRNIDKAIARLGESAGIAAVRSFEVPLEVATPAGKGVAVCRLAFIWINNLQYELIQPVSGLIDIYSNALPDDDSIKLHHIGMRVPDWDVFRERVDTKGYPVVFEGGNDALRFLYLDARKLVGHYLEYMWMTPERWHQMGGH